jgi:hypothetical protein
VSESTTRILYAEPYLYTVELDDNDAYVIDVCCGGVAMTSVRFTLEPSEVADFKRDPSSLKPLAWKTAKLGKSPR